MYLDYFGLTKPPFGITPDTSLFFNGGERGDVLEAVLYALNSGEGIIKVVGEVGSGKTMLSRMLTKNAPDNTVFVFLLNPRVEAEQVLYAIAHDLGLSVDANDKSIQILHILQQKLLELYQSGKKVALIIDEAQQMPISTLEEIRLLSNLETETEKLLQIILFGQPELDDHLDTPHIRQLRERITYSFYLNPLSRNTAEAYLQFRLAKAGHKGRTIFQQSAIKKLTGYSDGTLRRLNVLADKSLLAAFVEKSPVVESKHVRQAMNDGSKTTKESNGKVAIWFGVILLTILVGVAYYSPSKALMNLGSISPAPAPAPEEAVGTEADVEQEVSRISTKIEMGSLPNDLLDERLQAFENWHKRTSKKYTIRLLAASDESTGRIKDFLGLVKRNGNINQTYVAKLSSGESVYIIYYQDFDKYSEALYVLNRLPKRLKQYEPYISAVPSRS
jgi:type II secretory pathway predicted ATPase ExeA